MEYRSLGRTGWNISPSFGAWAIGGDVGKTDDAESMRRSTPQSIVA